MEDNYGVIGNPVEHSRSPQIHALFAEQYHQPMRYGRLLAEVDRFKETALEFFANGGQGLNVTVPFKEEAWQLAGKLSDRAQLAGAVNTLSAASDGTLMGDNTDGIGLVRDLRTNLGATINERRVLVLGAGGAVRGILEPLLNERPQELTIVNRTVARAAALRPQFEHLGKLQVAGYADLANQEYDLVINGTAASLQGELPPLPTTMLAEGALCYDLMYSAKPTPFLRWALQSGAAQVADGLGMLVEQAAESFLIWRGVRPDTAPVIRQLKQGRG